VEGWWRVARVLRGRGRVSRGMEGGDGFMMKQSSRSGEEGPRAKGVLGVREGWGVMEPWGMPVESRGR